MAIYKVKYMEKYAADYYVEANSPEEAEEKLMDALMEGEVDGPECCQDSGCESVKEVDDVDEREVDVR